MITKGFKECYTSNASNGSLGGSHVLWEDEKAGNAGSEHDSLSGECEEQNGHCVKTKDDRQQECWSW